MISEVNFLHSFKEIKYPLFTQNVGKNSAPSEKRLNFLIIIKKQIKYHGKG